MRGPKTPSAPSSASPPWGGVAFIVGGVSVLRDSGTLRSVALIGLGAAFIGGGVAFLRKTTLMGLIRALTHESNAEERER